MLLASVGRGGSRERGGSEDDGRGGEGEWSRSAGTVEKKKLGRKSQVLGPA